MDKHVIKIGDLPKLTMIARVASGGVSKDRWTELAVYHRDHPSRPWVGVVEGRSSIPGETVRFKQMAAGTLDRVMAWFEGGALTERLAEQVEKWVDDQVVVNATPVPTALGRQIIGTEARTSGSTVTENATEFFRAGRSLGEIYEPVICGEHAEHARFGYPGSATLANLLAWLYPDEQGSRTRRFEEDFSIPQRTARHALAVEAGEQQGNQGPWVQAMIAALRFFDRNAWNQRKEKQS